MEARVRSLDIWWPFLPLFHHPMRMTKILEFKAFWGCLRLDWILKIHSGHVRGKSKALNLALLLETPLSFFGTGGNYNLGSWLEFLFTFPCSDAEDWHAYHSEVFPAADHAHALSLIWYPLVPGRGCCWGYELQGLTLRETPLPWAGGTYNGDAWEPQVRVKCDQYSSSWRKNRISQLLNNESS
jgi:hypothetical protein